MFLEIWNKSSFSSRSTFVTALVLLEALAVYNWFVAPHQNYLRAAQNQESVTNILENKNRLLNNNIKLRKKQLAQLQTDIEDIESRLFTDKQADEFFSNINVISEKYGCSIDSLQSSGNKYSKNTANPEIKFSKSNSVQLDVIGQYDNITRFITGLQNNSKLVNINFLGMSPVQNNLDALKCELEITIYVITEKE